ncbi:hypothetical protein N7507_011672 [Penicillium longicatenatum]|nr:hypothetical protein N7507_011672 [Penicillium longicatenatum]
MPWPVRIEGKQAKTDPMCALHLLPPKQELALRPGRQTMWTGENLSREISLEIARVEAATIQVVGAVQQTDFTHCQQKDGPFALCVEAPGSSACGNCRWKGNMNGCLFYDVSVLGPPRPILPSRSGRRSRPAPSTESQADPDKQKKKKEEIDSVRQEKEAIRHERSVLKAKMKNLRQIIRDARIGSEQVADYNPQNHQTLSPEHSVHLWSEYNLVLRDGFVRSRRALIDEIMTTFEDLMTRDLALLDRLRRLFKST